MTLILLLQATEKSLTFSKVALEYLGFLPYILIYGALGFHFGVLRRRAITGDAESQIIANVDRSAAIVGLAGALLIPISYVITALSNSHSSSAVDAVLNAGQRAHVRAAFGVLLGITFALAARAGRIGWAGTAFFGVAFALRDVVSGQWTRLVNPLHEVAAGLWLGTLLVIVMAGLPAILGSESIKNRRQAMVADMVTRFSPLALGSAALLGLTGVLTSWLHLKYLAALWTTSYGYALDAKLAVVLVVVALGAWNWRRVAPRLNTDEATSDLRRSSVVELLFAALVLVITAILVSLPNPKLPGS